MSYRSREILNAECPKLTSERGKSDVELRNEPTQTPQYTVEVAIIGVKYSTRTGRSMYEHRSLGRRSTSQQCVDKRAVIVAMDCVADRVGKQQRQKAMHFVSGLMAASFTGS